MVITAKEAADLLRVSTWTIYELAKAGALTSFRVGRMVRFDSEDVFAFIQRGRGRSPGADFVVHDDRPHDPSVPGIEVLSSRSQWRPA